MRKLAFSLALLLPPISHSGGVKDFFLAVPPAAKFSFSVATLVDAASYSRSGEVNSGDVWSASTGLLLFGAPNAMILTNLLAGRPEQLTFWRKFVLYEETIFAGAMLTATLVGFLNSNEDIYPAGQRVEKDERFLFTERDILVFQLEFTAILGLSALIDLIPFSAEKRPGLALTLPFPDHELGKRTVGLKLSWPL